MGESLTLNIEVAGWLVSVDTQVLTSVTITTMLWCRDLSGSESGEAQGGDEGPLGGGSVDFSRWPAGRTPTW